MGIQRLAEEIRVGTTLRPAVPINSVQDYEAFHKAHDSLRERFNFTVESEENESGAVTHRLIFWDKVHVPPGDALAESPTFKWVARTTQPILVPAYLDMWNRLYELEMEKHNA